MTQPNLHTMYNTKTFAAYDSGIFSHAFFNLIIKNLVIICDNDMSIFAKENYIEGEVKNAQTVSA